MAFRMISLLTTRYTPGMIRINVYATLRPIIGTKSVEIPSGHLMTVGEVLEALFARYPDIKANIVDEQGALQDYVSLFVAGRDVRYLSGLETPLTAGQAIDIFPPVAGG